MRNILALLLVGLTSSLAFADAPAPAPVNDKDKDREQQVEYECKFEGRETCSKCDKEKLECWVEGTLCEKLTTAEERDRCRDGKDPVRIKCSNGFYLDTRDASVNVDNRTLWINADEKDSIATIRVEDFIDCKHGLDQERHKADLLISEEEGSAHRLDGVCKFKEKKRDPRDGDDRR